MSIRSNGFSPMRRLLVGAGIAAAALFGAQADRVWAQAQPGAQTPKTGAVREVTISTADGWRLAGTYYESTLGREAPVILLLHGEGGNRLDWTSGFAKRLQDEGYAVLAVDLRKHGQSVIPGVDAVAVPGRQRGTAPGLLNADYMAMVSFDLEAIKKFLLEEHQNKKLNIRKMAIVASDMTVPIAVSYALIDWQKEPYPDAPTLAARTPKGQDIRALVLLSPVENLPGIRAGQAYNSLRAPLWNIAVLVAAGDQDAQDRGAAKRIHQQLTTTAGSENRMYLKTYRTKFRGTRMLGQRLGLEEHMLAFFEQHLKRLNSDADAWRDRKSPLFSSD